LATLLVAAACTGTVQPGLPLVLLVIEGAPGATSAVLAYAVTPPGPATPRDLRALGSGTLTPGIDGPVVDHDWLDRDEVGFLGRSTLVLLVAEHAGAEDARAARLFGYDTTGFSVEAPSALEPVARLTFDLVVDGAFVPAVPPLVQAPRFGACLRALSVSGDGRFVAALDDRTACGETTTAGEGVLLLVDTEAGPLGTLVWSTVADPVRPVAPIVDQATGRLEFLRGTRLRSLSLLDLDDETESQPLAIGTFDPVLALGRHGDDRLVVVADRLHRIDPTGAVTSVSTRPNAIGLVDTGASLPVVVRTPTQLVLHVTPGDDDEAAFARAYTDGATDVTDRLTYLVRPGAIDTLDLLLYDRTAMDPIQAVLTPYPLPEVTAPRAITWFRPRLDAP
ncbi:MAG: hypothetical protein H0U69_13580, partial [Trueperaceae bacterium]|nr:hypothetical protein [Trueperaceae bacterium]